MIDRVEVDDREMRIVGRKDVLDQAVLALGGLVPGVGRFVRKWRAVNAPIKPRRFDRFERLPRRPLTCLA